MEETSDNTIPGLYLDTSRPAACGGQLTEWRLCYYRISAFRQYQVELQVWRVNSDGLYALIGTSTQTVNTFGFLDSPFSCRDFMLTENQYILVEQGDLLGVYLQDNSALTVIGSGTDQDILQHAVPMPASTAPLQLSLLLGVRMHISANIGKHNSQFSS